MRLKKREMEGDPAYPAEAWRYVETKFNEHALGANESLMTVSNGYLGIRGCHDEGEPAVESGTFINGFHETWPIAYPEEAYGLARTGQTMVNVTDAYVMRLFVDDEPLYLPTADLLEYERALDMREAVLTRTIVWATNAGKRLRVVSKRLASLEQRHVAAVWYQITALDGPAAVDVVSEIDCRFEDRRGGGGDPRAGRKFDGRVLEPRHHVQDGRRIILGHTTRTSGMSLACGVDHAVSGHGAATERAICEEALGKLIFSTKLQPGETVTVAKYIAYHTSRRTRAEDLTGRVHRTLDRAVEGGFEALLDAQRRRAEALWEASDIEIPGDVGVQQALRFNLFQLMQATARAEGSGVPAKGLTGQGYEGHYFWDTEIYLLPYLIYTQPHVARSVLKFRFGQLDKARQRAREVSEHGVLFPWRTINGEEASAYYAAGTAQYHINADIVYALRKYVEVTGDEQLLLDVGAEVLIETARFWRHLGFFSEQRGGAFCINGVTGPDEYNTVVNNNFYTNVMARENLWYAADVIERLERDHPAVLAELRRRTRLASDEPAEWRRAAEQMFVPYQEALGIHLQDDAFLDREPWDLGSISASQHPLLLHYHPLVIYRHRVIKQADVVLAMFLLGDQYSLDQKRRNFDFYDPLTTGDSSLSVCIEAVLAAELGYDEKAYQYARYATMMDLADINENVEQGCHIASMGGTWMVMVYGLAGFRDHHGLFRFAPSRPRAFQRLRIPLRLRNCRLDIELDQESIRYTLRAGDRLSFRHYAEQVTLEGEGTTLELGYPQEQ